MTVYNLELDENITSFSFYNKILPKLNYYFKYNRNEQLIFDFSQVDFINPLVIPNICITGLILRNNLEQKVDMYIPWKPKLLSYLQDISFLSIIKQYDLFNIDERYIGGYEVGGLFQECNTFVFDKGSTKAMIRNELLKSEKVISRLYSGSKNFKERAMDEILHVFTEFCHNACFHSGSACFATFQTNLGDKTSFKKAYISISDCGMGYYNSIVQKITDTDVKLNFLPNCDFNVLLENKNLYGILEAIFYRYNDKIYGIYQLFEYILKVNGVIRIHSEDTQLVFTKKSIENYILNGEWKCLPDYFMNYYYKLKGESLDEQYSPIRVYDSKLKGVHIEIEIPIV